LEPILVSRARKKPELEFLEEKQAASALLSAALQDMRTSFQHSLGRIQKGLSTLEQRIAHTALNHDPLEQSLEASWKSLEDEFLKLREAILADALFYEACRSQLKSVQERVLYLRCLEDVYGAVKGSRS